MEWGNIADWVSGLGSVAAVGSAIWIASKESRPKLLVDVIKDDFRHQNHGEQLKRYDICLYNVRTKVVHVRYIGFYYKDNFKTVLLGRERSGKSPLIDSIKSGEVKVFTREVNVSEFHKKTNGKRKKIHVIVEDIEGKKYRTKFTP
ncbi:hypothetical protein [Lysinibacillus sp. NPDC086135]|uniref:hypothetical protein n=1 Tax=Lysinibacillus sp. NPDC086135 TaxID=3364130 RepID=UPI003805177B